VLDAMLFEIVFDVTSDILASSIRMEYLDPLTSFQFCLCNKRLKSFAYF